MVFRYLAKIIIKYWENLLKIVRFVMRFFLLVVSVSLASRLTKNLCKNPVCFLSYLISMSVSASILMLLLHYEILEMWARWERNSKHEWILTFKAKRWREKSVECERKRRRKKKLLLHQHQLNTKQSRELLKFFQPNAGYLPIYRLLRPPARQLRENEQMKRAWNSWVKQEQTEILLFSLENCYSMKYAN